MSVAETGFECVKPTPHPLISIIVIILEEVICATVAQIQDKNKIPVSCPSSVRTIPELGQAGVITYAQGKRCLRIGHSYLGCRYISLEFRSTYS